jgi:ATP-dependent DNA helicase RecG
MEQPGIYTPAAYAGIQGTMQPRYSLTRGLKNNQVKKAVGQALEEYVFPQDYIPDRDRDRLGLTGLRQAYRQIHFPMNMEELSEARRRLIFDEFFEFILSVRRQKEAGEELVNTRPMEDRPEVEAFAERLPFVLTEGQKQAWNEIRRDLTGPRLMNRLLQGDVGSGKTILAFLALYLCAANGRQGALMAPTEVLAGQHMKSLTELIERYDLPLRPVLLTGSLTAARKRDIYERIRLGMADIIIGTHALIQDAVE